MSKVVLNVNGREHSLDVDEKTPLVYVLRNDLGLKGSKIGCGLEQCGACMVIIDGKAEYSCNTPVAAVAGRAITTIEGIGTASSLHPLQQAFVTERAAQCGYCIPGIIVAAKALLDANPDPSEQEIRLALADNLCRCGTHARIIKAVMRAAKDIRA
ncbi:MAG: (2Fe-2S)-binding protein [Proteobacteria bacterium]|nr:(2Fe-2S)-binding protein [Pseudomonadota bacterium]